jgi:hypothetical protein
MGPSAVSVVALACIFAGALFGMFLSARLPKSHLSADTKDVVRLGVGLIGTLAALVIGLMIASAKSSYDTQSGYISRVSADIVLLDRLLAEYGSETREARDLLRRSIDPLIDQIWGESDSGSPSTGPFAPNGMAQAAFQKTQELAPKSEEQRSLQARAIAIETDLAQTRFLVSARAGNPIPTPFIVILVFWLAMIFASFSLFAPPNATITIILFFLAVSASGAIFLILDLSQPFSGLMTVSSEPLRNALAPPGPR